MNDKISTSNGIARKTVCRTGVFCHSPGERVLSISLVKLELPNLILRLLRRGRNLYQGSERCAEVRWRKGWGLFPLPSIVHSDSKSNMAGRTKDRALVAFASPNETPALQATWKTQSGLGNLLRCFSTQWKLWVASQWARLYLWMIEKKKEEERRTYIRAKRVYKYTNQLLK